MNTTRCKREPQNRRTRRNHFLTALFVAAMVMILTVPVFAAEATVTTSEPDTEVSTSTPDLTEPPLMKMMRFLTKLIQRRPPAP